MQGASGGQVNILGADSYWLLREKKFTRTCLNSEWLQRERTYLMSLYFYFDFYSVYAFVCSLRKCK